MHLFLSVRLSSGFVGSTLCTTSLVQGYIVHHQPTMCTRQNNVVTHSHLIRPILKRSYTCHTQVWPSFLQRTQYDTVFWVCLVISVCSSMGLMRWECVLCKRLLLKYVSPSCQFHFKFWLNGLPRCLISLQRTEYIKHNIFPKIYGSIVLDFLLIEVHFNFYS